MAETEALTGLHAEIMKLPCVVPGGEEYADEAESFWVSGFKRGHHDARRAAAELVSAALSRLPAPEAAEPVATVDALMEAVRKYGEECGALVMQKHGHEMNPPAARREAWEAVRPLALSLAAPVPVPTAATAVTREFTNELGNRIRITIEGPTSTSENVLTPVEAQELLAALAASPSVGDRAPTEATAPEGWLYDWTHSSALGKPDEQFTGFTTDEAHARKHDNVRPVWTAALAAPVPVPTAATADQGDPAEFTTTSRQAIAWVLWHHQGASSKVGQAMRFALGMSETEPMSDWMVADAKRWAEFVGDRASPTAAPAKLTDEMIGALYDEEFRKGGFGLHTLIAFARAIERAVLSGQQAGVSDDTKRLVDSHNRLLRMVLENKARIGYEAGSPNDKEVRAAIKLRDSLAAIASATGSNARSHEGEQSNG